MKKEQRRTRGRQEESGEERDANSVEEENDGNNKTNKKIKGSEAPQDIVAETKKMF